MGKIYQNSVGVLIDLDTKIEPATLATATSVTIAVSLPDATTGSWPATVIASTSKIRHNVVSNDFAQAGKYKLQAVLGFPGGSIVKSETVDLIIYAPFK